MTKNEVNDILMWTLYKVMTSTDDNPYMTPPSADKQKQAIRIARDAFTGIYNIKSEIEDLMDKTFPDDGEYFEGQFTVYKEILEIISKYIGENEEWIGTE